MRPRHWVATALVVTGAMFFLLWLQSPSRQQWTGIAVTGHSDGGVVYYTYQGRQGTILDPNRPATDHSGAPVTVYLDRGHPTDTALAQVQGAAKWWDAALLLSWFLAAAVVLVVGSLRRRRRTGRRARPTRIEQGPFLDVEDRG